MTKSLLVEPLKFYYDILRGFGSLRVEDINTEDDFSVIINDYFENLYCIEVAGAGESVQFLPDTLIDSLSSDFKEDETGELVWVLIQDEPYKKNLIFTRSRSMAEKIVDQTSSMLLPFDEIFNRLLSLYFNNEYEIDWYNRTLVQQHKVDLLDEYKNPLNTLNALIRERTNANYHKMKYYQATTYKNDLKDDDIKFKIFGKEDKKIYSQKTQ